MLNILIFSGSVRRGNFTQHVAHFVQEVTSQRPDLHTDLVTPTTFPLSFEDEGESACPPQLKQLVKDADAYIIVAPEYNHGYPGSLKYLLDLNLKEYIHKPVSFVGVSKGPWGGTRMIEELVGVVRELGLVATFTDTNVTNVQKQIIDGKFVKPEDWQRRINRMLDELMWMTRTLKDGREKYPSEY